MDLNQVSTPRGEALRAFWDENEARNTSEAKCIKAIDCFLPTTKTRHCNTVNVGEIWKCDEVSLQQVQENIAIIREGANRCANLAFEMVLKAVQDGFLSTW